MRTLHELATKLQDYIIKAQADTFKHTTLNVAKYNNLKIKIDLKYHFPNVIICIGISEAVYDIKEFIKVSGSLGPDEKYVKKWMELPNILPTLYSIWLSMIDATIKQKVEAEKGKKILELEGEANEAEDPNKRRSQVTGNATIEEFFGIKTVTKTPINKSKKRSVLDFLDENNDTENSDKQ